ncbi:MAG: dynamin family protein [Pseudomonadota bacterium]
MTDQITRRKPRIALMGEFSAGKSTLSNLLLGSRPLPEKVTATRLSPVWMASGMEPPYRIDVDGTEELVSIEHLEEIPVEETRVIRLFFESDILDVCDLIDFPGISDPNMSTDVVERMLEEVDAVLWCTHATQAWRQSEQAVWEQMPEEVKKRSILLITRFDKLTTERDRGRVLKRVMHETKGQFGGTFPISLLQALQAGEDFDKWDSSGAGAFSDHLIEMVQELTLAVADKTESLYVLGQRGETVEAPAGSDALLLTNPVVAGRDPSAGPVVPRRVAAKSNKKVQSLHTPDPENNGKIQDDMGDNLANNTQIAS